MILILLFIIIVVIIHHIYKKKIPIIRIRKTATKKLKILENLLSTNYDHEIALGLYYEIVDLPAEQHRLKRVKSVLDSGEKIEPVVKIKNDMQNVHDTYLNNDMSSQYFSMLSRLGDAYPPLIIQNQWMADNLSKQYVFSKFNATEEQIYFNIWKRIFHKDNVHHRESLMKSFHDTINSLSASTCINGRVANMMGSLAVADPLYGRFITKDFLKLEILEKARLLFYKEVDKHSRIGKYQDAAKTFKVQSLSEMQKLDDSLVDDFVEVSMERIRKIMKKDYPHIIDFDKIFNKIKRGICIY